MRRRARALLLAVLALSCKDPVAVRYENPADAASPAYVPAPPAALTVTMMSDTLFTVQWTDRSDGEEGFRVSLRSGTDTTYTLLATLPPGSAAFNDTLPKLSGVPYRYRIASFSAAGESAAPAETTVSFFLHAPVITQISGSDSTSLLLTWTPDAPFPTETVVERRTGNGAYALIARTTSGTTGYADTGVHKSSVYEYRLTSATPRQSTPVSEPARCGYSITVATPARSISTAIEPVSAMTGVFSDDETTFLSVGDLHLSVVNYTAGTVVRTFSIYDGPLWTSRYSVTEAAMSADKSTAALLRDSSVYVYRLSTGALVRRIVFHAWNHGIAMNADGSRFFVGTSTGTVQCWNIADSTVVWSHNLGTDIVTVWLHPDGAHLLAGNGSSFHLLDPQTGATVATYPGGPFKRTPKVLGNDIVATTTDGAVRVVKEGTIIANFGAMELFSHAVVDVTADRLFATTAVYDFRSRVHSLTSGKSIVHANSLFGWHKFTHFMQNDRQVLVYNQEGTIGVWNLVYGWMRY